MKPKKTISMKKLFLTLSLVLPLAASAQEDVSTDSITTALNEVVIEGRSQRLGSEVSTYIPSSKQKNASLTATDLLDRMAIPQLKVSPGGSITDLAGKSVDLFIDFLPASKEDLEGMRLQDVKKVEYYDYPSDPRFQGKAHVVNFIMQKYEYGGYVKAYGWENTGNAGQLSFYSKVQYRRMTFDIAAGAFYINQSHTGGDTYETFRLPQPDGTMKVFGRSFIQGEGKLRKRTYWPTIKALYSSDRLTIQNTIGADFNHTPRDTQSGLMVYTPEISSPAEIWDSNSSRVNSLSYAGYWNFIINDLNTITFSPGYSFSHTSTGTRYMESNGPEYYNAATDNSHQLRGDLTFSHSFGGWGTLNASLRTVITSSRTSYSGTANTNDHARSYRFGPGVQYSVSKGKVYSMVGFGLNCDRQEYLDNKESSASPWADFSLQYSPGNRHSLRGNFNYRKMMPSSSYRSAAIIQSNPLMSYTGNPDLRSEGSYEAGASYSFIPDNRFSMSAFASAWILDNRYAYDYVPTATGILRTLRQPAGGYSQWNYGVYATARLLDRKLQVTAQLSTNTVRNGEPYNLYKTQLNYAFQANLYLGNWTVSGIYYAPQGYPDGSMVGTWMKTKTYYMLQAGWAASSWNVQLQLASFARWNWRSDRSVMHSPYYDRTEQTYSINDHALARLAVTYTFGFGKKVERGDEATQQSGIGSGILK